MAYFSLHAYDADVWVPGFLGLNQADVGLNPDVRNAAEAENVVTIHGVLQPQAACPELEGSFESRVETLASFYRRWYEGVGSKEWYICASGGKLYYKQAGETADWMEIPLPSGIEAFQSNVWSWVTYETSSALTENSVDVLLLSNALDGMYMIVPPDRPTTHDDLSEFTHEALSARTHDELSSPAWAIRTIDTNGKKFGSIERYNERIWGCAIPGDPDMLMYSAPYDPTDWDANEEIPEDGAGDILQPSWDGDSFTALKKFGDYLLAFKRNRVWRVIGVSPGEFTMNEQYGGGAKFANTIDVYGERVFIEEADGLAVFDGMNATPFDREAVEGIWKSINRSAMDQICATIYKARYYVAFPVGNSSVNNAMLVYDLTEGTVLYYKDFHVESFMPTEDELFFTSSTLPGKVLKLRYDSWEDGRAIGAATKWVSPWIDFGYKRIQKGGFDLYFVPEVKDTPVELKFSVQTEKKMKSKTYTIQPTVGDREHKGKRLHFSGNGRRFRFIIESEAGITAPWRLIGGIQMVVETDPD